MKKTPHPSIGVVTYKKNKRSKHIRITIKTQNEVQVTVPENISYEKAEQFLTQHLAWVEKKQAALKESGKIRPDYDWGSEFKTKLTSIRVMETELEQAFIRQEKDFLGIYIPKGSDIQSEAWQKTIRKQIENQLRREAKYYLLKRSYEIAKEKSISIGKVSVRSSKTRWGSCSSSNDISLSIYCMTLPDELIDYIICHELAHVKEKNHSPAFWAHLELILPGAGQLDKEMKKYSTKVV